MTQVRANWPPNNNFNAELPPELPSPRIDEGFFNGQTIEGQVAIAGTTSHYILEIPKEPIDSTVNVLIYGFAGSEPAYRGLARALTDEGLINMRCRLSRQQKLSVAMHPKHLFNPTALTSKIVHGAIGNLSEHGLSNKVNIVGHSMGGLIGTEFALHKPQFVNQLTLLSSAGLIEQSPRTLAPGVPKLIGRLISELAIYKEFKPTTQDAIDCLKHIAINPLLTISEAIKVGNCDIRPYIRDLHPEVKLAILQPTEDELFDFKSVVSASAGLTDNFRGIEGVGHGAPITRPSLIAKAYAELIKDKLPINLVSVA